MTIALIACGALVVSGVSWVLALSLAWPWWVPGIVSAVGMAVAGACGAAAFHSRRRLRSPERQLNATALAVQSAHAGAGVARIRAIEQNIKAAARALGRTRLGRRGKRAALYALPWYAIVGDSGSGKTATLERSGLDFAPIEPVRGGAVTGSETPSCEFWFSEAAVLIDTPGRLLEQEHAGEWTAFLTNLRRYRARRPLDGVMVTLAADRLIHSSREELEVAARRVRLHLDELHDRLDLLVPVYLLVTRADHIAGFAEFWREAGSEISAQPWGATFSLEDRRLEQPEAAVLEELAGLGKALHARAFRQLFRTTDADDREALLRFPQRFASMGAQLACFAGALARSNRYRQRPAFRGFYFSSARAERALRAELPVLAPRRTEGAAGSGRIQGDQAPRGMFLKGLFRSVIFADRDVATQSGRRLRTETRKELALLGATILATLLVVLPAISSYRRNSRIIEATRDDVRRVAAHARVSDPSFGPALDVLSNRLLELEAASDGFRVRHWWGAYTSPVLAGAVRTAYMRRLEAAVSGPVRDQLVSTMRSVGDLPRLDSNGFQAAHDGLKLYLMLTDPGRLNVEWATPALASVWARVRLRGAYSGQGQLEPHADRFLRSIVSNGTAAWAENAELVSRSRARLAEVAVSDLKYAALQAAASDAAPVRPEHVFVGPAARYVRARAGVEVPGLYTALGWQKVSSFLAQQGGIGVDDWVLGRAGTAVPWTEEQMRKTYFERYGHAWVDFMVGLDVETPQTLRAAIDQFDALSRADGPFVRLFEKLAENVRLKIAPSARELAEAALRATAAGTPASVLEPEPSLVERQFRGVLAFAFGEANNSTVVATSPLGQYLDQLRTVQVGLRQLDHAEVEPDAEFMAQMERAALAVQHLLSPLERADRLVLEGLLMKPLRGGQTLVRGKDTSLLTERWRADVFAPVQDLLRYYPFDPAARSDVPLTALSEFLAPGKGALWKFFDARLASRITVAGGRFVAKTANDGERMQAGLLHCLDVAKDIGEAVFGSGSEHPSVPFAVRLSPVGQKISSVSLSVDGRTVVYDIEPEKWQALEWPGTGAPGAAIAVQGPGFKGELRHEGEFGFVRLLNAGGIRPTAPGERLLEATWDVGDGTRVNIQLRPASDSHPFGHNFFQRLKCPSQPFNTNAVL